jgi:hypothetical protein
LHPLDRTPSAPRETLLDLALLFRDVYVHHSGLAELDDRRQLRRRHGTQAVGRHPDTCPAERPHHTAARLEDAREAFDISHEAPMPG